MNTGRMEHLLQLSKSADVSWPLTSLNTRLDDRMYMHDWIVRMTD